jgi:hypothetical protein
VASRKAFFLFFLVLPSKNTFTEQNSWDFNGKKIGNEGRRVCSRIGDSVTPQFMSMILNQRYLGYLFLRDKFVFFHPTWDDEFKRLSFSAGL